MRKQRADTAHAGLHFIEHQNEFVLIAQLTKSAEERRIRGTHAALALPRLDDDARGVRTDSFLGGFEIAERHLIEPVDNGSKAFEIFLLPTRRERREGAAMEGTFKSDQAIAFRLAVCSLILPRHLDAGFHRLRTGIAEERNIGKARFAQPRGKTLAFRNPETGSKHARAWQPVPAALQTR